MAIWKDTYAKAGAEIQSAQAAAVAAFMAAPAGSDIESSAAVPPVLSRTQLTSGPSAAPLSPEDRASLLIVTWRAIARAVLKHIGPVSSDGSVLLDVLVDADGVPQLNIRSSAGAWMHIQQDPVSTSLPGARETIAWQEDPATYLPVAIWVKNGDADGEWSMLWPTSGALDSYEVKATSTDTTHGALIDELEGAGGTTVDVDVVAGKPIVRVSSAILSDQMPHPVGIGVPGPGVGDEKSRFDHNHELVLPPTPPVTPAQAETTLYTAFVKAPGSAKARCLLAPNLRWADADAVLNGPSGCTDGTWYPLTGWSQGPAGTWTHTSKTVLPSAFIDNQTPTVGMRLFVGATGASIDQRRDFGIYEMLDTGRVASGGDPGSYPVIRRATDADASSEFVWGKLVNVLHGTLCAGHTYRYTGDSFPILGTDVLPFSDHGTTSVYKTGTFGFGTLWQQVSGIATWQKHNDGLVPPEPINGLAADGSGTSRLDANDFFFILATGAEAQYAGLYQLVSTGSGGESPVIRRAAVANTEATLTGLKVKIGDGVLNAGTVYEETATITAIDFTATTWTTGADATGSYELLTGPQLVSEGASSDYLDFAWTMANGNASAPGGFETIVGFPGLDEIRAAIWQFDNELVWIDPSTPPSAGSVTTLRWRRLLDHGGSSTELAYAESPPLINTTPIFLSFQLLAGAETCSPTDRLVVIPELHTTSTTPVTLHLRYNSPSRGTRFTVPFAMTVTGSATGDHLQLSNTDQDVASSDPAKAKPDHPADAIGAGRLHRNIGAGTISAGILTLPDNATQCRVTLGDGATAMIGITTTRLLDGDPIMVDFPNADPTRTVELSDMVGVNLTSYPTAAPMAMQAVGGVAGGMIISHPTTVYLWLDMARGCFRFDRKASTS